MRYQLEAGGVRVGIDGGRIVTPDGRFDFAMALDTGELRPGLINAHDHLHRNHYPRPGAPPYPDAYAWGADLHANFATEIARARTLPRRDALLFGALRNLLGGVTAVVHHDPWEPDFDRDFPIRVVRLRCVHSTGFDAAGVAAAAAAKRSALEDPGQALPLTIHVAEGVTRAAADEVRDLDRAGLIDRSLLAVHLVGVDDDGIARLHNAGAATVWCPTSNLFLFGRTAPAALFAAGDVLIGTDSLLTAAGTMLDELRAARTLGHLDDDRLEAAVGVVAARRLRIPPRTLAPGEPADLVLLRRPLFEATQADVALVVIGGVPRLGTADFAPLFEGAGVDTGEIAVGGETRLVIAPLADVAARVIREWPDAARIFSPPAPADEAAAGIGGDHAAQSVRISR